MKNELYHLWVVSLFVYLFFRCTARVSEQYEWMYNIFIFVLGFVPLMFLIALKKTKCRTKDSSIFYCLSIVSYMIAIVNLLIIIVGVIGIS